MINKIKQKLNSAKAVYNSRKIIKNAYSSLYQYLILRKPYIELKLRNGETLIVPRFLYSEIVRNYYLGYIVDISKDKIKLKLNGKEYFIPTDILSYININGIITFIKSGWDDKGNYWEKNGLKFRYIYSSVYDTFIEEEYKFLNVKDKNVLDIGAFVGDSPIYFILKGAKKVYAIEPHPDAYNEMLENIKLNNMEDKIVPINVGISYESDYISISTTKANTQHILLKPEERGYKIPAYSLSKLIDKYNVDAQILKMDCEGCEYNVILKDYDTIKEFEEIEFEYHAHNTKMPVNKLLEKLNKDFECKFVREFISKDLGIIYCIRKS